MGEVAAADEHVPDRWRVPKMLAGLGVALLVRWLCGTALTGWPLMIVLLVGAFWEPLVAFAWTVPKWVKIILEHGGTSLQIERSRGELERGEAFIAPVERQISVDEEVVERLLGSDDELPAQPADAT